ncbi:glycosyltransferase family 2 protein [Clostridium perfringens]|nr:glycosyltransferase family 2 protein [Clostridium perfringens]
MKEIRILAIIISYNPDLNRLYKNIEALVKQVDEILIVDNSSNNILEINNMKNNFDKVKIISHEENLGISISLNKGLEYARKNNYNWILTMDQDSICQANMINNYKKFIKLNKEINSYMILAPYILYENVLEYKYDCLGEEIDVVITSGSLVNVENAIKIGGFDEKLFIDYVDFEFCLRTIENNFKIIKIYGSYLEHRLGELEEKSIINRKILVTNHSFIRRYYIYRNAIYVWKKYILKNPKWVIKNILSNIKSYLLILLFEKDKMRKTIYILNGIKDGIFNNLGIHKF